MQVCCREIEQSADRSITVCSRSSQIPHGDTGRFKLSLSPELTKSLEGYTLFFLERHCWIMSVNCIVSLCCPAHFMQDSDLFLVSPWDSRGCWCFHKCFCCHWWPAQAGFLNERLDILREERNDLAFLLSAFMWNVCSEKPRPCSHRWRDTSLMCVKQLSWE